MAVYHSHSVKCVCGNQLTVQLADSLNVKRFPEVRNRILRGELHRAACPKCHRELTVEKPFYYTDLTRASVFKVCPRGERHTWRTASRELDAAASYIPKEIRGGNATTLRVLFGMDELREKLVAEDAGLDDRIVELLKVLLVYEHPVVLRKPRLRLVLDRVTKSDLEFVAAYEHHPQQFRLRMPLEVAEGMQAQRPNLEQWTSDAHSEKLFKLPDHWVNLWRWSPQPSALEQLKAYADAIEANKPIDTNTASFQKMLKGLPRGSQLPSWAKKDLRTLFEFAKKHELQTLEDELFEIRFGFELEDDWSANDDRDDIDTLWQLLKDLPDTNVEGNTKIHEIRLELGEGGGFYSPQSHDIAIGSKELMHRERFQDVVRHEVGHAVHEKEQGLIDGWLAKRFGWRTFEASDADVDQWVGLMGGWGALTAPQKRDCRNALRTALGNGSSWNPGPAPALPAGHPWNGASFGPRLAYEKSGANWYQNFGTWHRANGKAFFLNYWYQTLIAVDISTLELIEQMPDDYAAMSHFEFFAELYALYYDLDDPKRPVIPSDVTQWLQTNIGAPEVDAPMPSRKPAKRRFETVTRPGKSRRV